jgi:hypothetical protein
VARRDVLRPRRCPVVPLSLNERAAPVLGARGMTRAGAASRPRRRGVGNGHAVGDKKPLAYLRNDAASPWGRVLRFSGAVHGADELACQDRVLLRKHRAEVQHQQVLVDASDHRRVHLAQAGGQLLG